MTQIENIGGLVRDRRARLILARTGARLSWWRQHWASVAGLHEPGMFTSNGPRQFLSRPATPSSKVILAEAISTKAVVTWSLAHRDAMATARQAEQYSKESMISAWVESVEVNSPATLASTRGALARYAAEARPGLVPTPYRPARAATSALTTPVSILSAVPGFFVAIPLLGQATGPWAVLGLATIVGVFGLMGDAITHFSTRDHVASTDTRRVEGESLFQSRGLALAMILWLDLIRLTRDYPEQLMFPDLEKELHHLLWWSAGTLGMDKDMLIDYRHVDRLASRMQDLRHLVDQLVQLEDDKGNYFDFPVNGPDPGGDRLQIVIEMLRNEIDATRAVYGN